MAEYEKYSFAIGYVGTLIIMVIDLCPAVAITAERKCPALSVHKRTEQPILNPIYYNIWRLRLLVFEPDVVHAKKNTSWHNACHKNRGILSKMLTVLEHPLIAVKVTELRDKNTPPHQFRKTLYELAGLMSFEVFSFLKTADCTVTTPLEDTKGYQLYSPEPCLVSILRAGNGLADAFSAILPQAAIGHLGLQRNEQTFEAESYYEKLPPQIAHRQIILADPMLATGGSAIMAADRLKQLGVTELVFACLIAAPEGVSAFEKAHPDISIITACLDRELNENCYILPGLGDAGDRIYNT